MPAARCLLPSGNPNGANVCSIAQESDGDSVARIGGSGSEAENTGAQRGTFMRNHEGMKGAGSGRPGSLTPIGFESNQANRSLGHGEKSRPKKEKTAKDSQDQRQYETSRCLVSGVREDRGGHGVQSHLPYSAECFLKAGWCWFGADSLESGIAVGPERFFEWGISGSGGDPCCFSSGRRWGSGRGRGNGVGYGGVANRARSPASGPCMIAPV